MDEPDLIPVASVAELLRLAEVESLADLAYMLEELGDAPIDLTVTEVPTGLRLGYSPPSREVTCDFPLCVEDLIDHVLDASDECEFELALEELVATIAIDEELDVEVELDVTVPDEEFPSSVDRRLTVNGFRVQRPPEWRYTTPTADEVTVGEWVARFVLSCPGLRVRLGAWPHTTLGEVRAGAAADAPYRWFGASAEG